MSARRVVVVGGGVGGLSAAIHARLLGYEVTLLEAHRIGGKAARIETRGYSLDPGPSIVILPEIYEAIFQAASRRPSDYLRFDRLDPIARVYFERASGPVDLPADRDECIETVRRIDPHDGDALAGLLKTLDGVAAHVEASVFKAPIHDAWQLLNPRLIAIARLFWSFDNYKDLIDRTFRSPIARAFFYGFPSYSGQTYDEKAVGALLIPYYMLTRGVFYPRGGVAAIPQALHRLAFELGVEVREGCPVVGLRTCGRRVESVELDDGEEVVADAVVSNVDRSTTRCWLGACVEARPSFSYFTVHWGVRRLLPALAHHTLLIPSSFAAGFDQLYRERRFPDEPIVYLCATGAAPAGCTNLFAAVTSPACEASIDWETLESEALRRVKAALVKFGLPVDASDSDFERVQTPIYFANEHGNYKGSLYGTDSRLFGLFPERCADERFGNLLYCGGSVQPGAGLPMVALSGKFAANLLHRRLDERLSDG